jgi:hypothetical protein
VTVTFEATVTFDKMAKTASVGGFLLDILHSVLRLRAAPCAQDVLLYVTAFAAEAISSIRACIRLAFSV